MGSHIDSVATAGIFDGCLGVLGGLEVVRTLDGAGRRTRRPVVVAFFTEEEGARFGTDMLGSAVATGRIPLQQAYGLRDRAGKAVGDELAAIGFKGDAEEILAPPHAYLECHVEQGPVLRAEGFDIGVVTGVQAICWHEVTILGKSAHAGTTPMSLRADAGVAAARINLGLREMVGSGRFGEDLRATMGVILPHPGLVNVVPGRVVCSVDVRNPDDAVLERAEAEVLSLYESAARAEHVQVNHRRTARTPFVPFADKVRSRVAAAAAARGLSHREIVSGAGHDAQEMARVCPAGMVFVPGERQEDVEEHVHAVPALRQGGEFARVVADAVVLAGDEDHAGRAEARHLLGVVAGAGDDLPVGEPARPRGSTRRRSSARTG